MYTARPENAHVISKLENFLAQHSLEKEVISYEELNEVADADVQNGKRYLLAAAVEKAEKRLGCLFAAVTGIGIRRLPADSTHMVGHGAIGSVRRKSKRAMKRMVRVNSNQMSADGRQLASLKAAHLGLIYGLADNRRSKEIVRPATSDPFAAKKATGKKE